MIFSQGRKLAWFDGFHFLLRNYRLAALFGGLLVFALYGSITSAQQEEGLSCKYVYPIEQGFLNQHIVHSKRDEVLRDRVIAQYLKTLDRTKIYFTVEDIEKIRPMMGDVFEKVKNRDCSAIEAIQKIYVARVTERAEFAKQFLGKNYKFDSNVEFEFDPDKKPYPANKKEAEQFLEKYIHFQVSNYLATDMKLAEAKSNVSKNYDRLLKRYKERKTDDIYSEYLDSFARSLDPHSSFFSRDVLEDFEIGMSLSLEGIGATLSSQDGFTVIEYLVPGGAAARSGQLKTSDKIIAVGQGDKGKLDNVIEMDLRDVVAKIRGKKGTKVRLLILRKEGEKKSRFEVTLVRDKIKLEDEAVSIKYIDKEEHGVKRKVGLINFPSFYSDARRGGRSSAADLKKIITEAKEQKVDGLVLDLSTNGGGSLEDAVKAAGLFFRTGNVVKQSSRDELRGEVALADVDPAVDYTGPLVVLTSRMSASASEIVAGTLQDYKRAVVVGGDHTFGKGSIQSVVQIPQRLGAIKVTVGMFFTPGGNSTQHRGVEADIAFPSAFNGEDMGEKTLDYSLPPKKIAAFLSPEAYVKDGPSAWKAVDAESVKLLKERSQIRTAANDDFKKIIEDAKKAESRGKTIKVAEILKDKEDKSKKDKAKRYAPKEEKEQEYLKRADVQEALSILNDLISIESKQKLSALPPSAKRTSAKN